MPDAERAEVYQIFHNRGLRGELLDQVVAHITADPKLWVEEMMRHELNLSEPAGGSFLRSVLVGASCAIGSAVPIVPYLAESKKFGPLMRRMRAPRAADYCRLAAFGCGRFRVLFSPASQRRKR